MPLRAEYDLWNGARHGYGYGVYRAADLAAALDMNAISVLECGVLSGFGLESLERVSDQIGAHFGIDIQVVGFDSPAGLPEPVDFRDCPHVWAKGFYAIDEAAIRSRLRRAELIVGDSIGVGIRAFLEREGTAPVGFVAVNLDYWSLTLEALEAVADAGSDRRLPRVLTLFDDLVWPERAYHNTWTGELRAVRDFNEARPKQKVARVHGLRWTRRMPAFWNDAVYVLHDFEHPSYGRLITPEGAEYRQP